MGVKNSGGAKNYRSTFSGTSWQSASFDSWRHANVSADVDVDGCGRWLDAGWWMQDSGLRTQDSGSWQQDAGCCLCCRSTRNDKRLLQAATSARNSECQDAKMLQCESAGVAFMGELFFALYLVMVMVMRPEPESILRN
uniref:GG17045 n=1 Tax=Drosophila erecta TaxID=7220 RepID=B3P444_DROER